MRCNFVATEQTRTGGSFVGIISVTRVLLRYSHYHAFERVQQTRLIPSAAPERISSPTAKIGLQGTAVFNRSSASISAASFVVSPCACALSKIRKVVS